LKGNTDDQALAIGESLVVEGTTGNEYIISREGKNEWFCTCPARKFAKKDEGGEKPHCKHILAIMDEYTATGQKPESVRAAPAQVREASGKSAAQASRVGSVDTISFGSLKISALKDLLRHNDQLLSGKKAELVDRVVDRYEHGNLPRCPSCGIGRLKPTGQSGTRFVCPGGYDDDKYTHCFFSTDAPERTPFVLPPGFNIDAPAQPEQVD